MNRTASGRQRGSQRGLWSKLRCTHRMIPTEDHIAQILHSGVMPLPLSGSGCLWGYNLWLLICLDVTLLCFLFPFHACPERQRVRSTPSQVRFPHRRSAALASSLVILYRSPRQTTMLTVGIKNYDYKSCTVLWPASFQKCILMIIHTREEDAHMIKRKKSNIKSYRFILGLIGGGASLTYLCRHISPFLLFFFSILHFLFKLLWEGLLWFIEKALTPNTYLFLVPIGHWKETLGFYKLSKSGFLKVAVLRSYILLY